MLSQVESRVCTEHVMPHAKPTHDIFWTSVDPNMVAQLQVFGDNFKSEANAWNGTLCGEFTPGGDTPISYYQDNIQTIWNGVGTDTAACTSCHAGDSPPAGLKLTAAVSYANLVDVNSTQVTALKRIKPNDAANSYLIHKVEGTQAVYGQMPLGGAPLSVADINKIKDWINAGALP